MALTLAQLCAPWPELVILGRGDLPIARVSDDSRQVGTDTLFVAVQGTGADGHRFVPAALTQGAPAVAVDAARLPEIRSALPDREPAAWVTAPSTRGLPSRLARECEGRPDSGLITAGVTGTNGKTTVAFLLRALLSRLEGRCGLLGTIRYDDGVAPIPAPLTTPGGPVLYHWLARMRDAGCRAVAMEISSHALDQERVGDLALDVAVMTNLGRDHLDYHRDLAAYLAAKARILDLLRDGPRRGKRPGVAVINGADPAFVALATEGLEVLEFRAQGDGDADVRVLRARLDAGGTELELDVRGRALRVQSPLVGRFNVENLTAALTAGIALGFDAQDCATALGDLPQVPGRLERFTLPVGALAVVDYAHTPDALAAVLVTCRELVRGRLIAVFGCGGDRDRGKRPLMGAAAAELADLVWITSDNPRSEAPEAIAAAIAAGFDAAPARRATAREVVLDRRTAIEAALAAAREGDVVVIAGKGHEDYQLVGTRRLHLDDREIVRTWIEHDA